MDEREFKKRFLYIFNAPTIVFKGTEMAMHQTIRNLSTDITIHRMANTDWENGKASDFEAMLYIQSVTVVGPLDDDWFRIYAYLFHKFYPEVAENIMDEHDYAPLNQNQERMLNSLKEHIFETQMRAVKKMMKEMDSEKEPEM